MCVIAQGAPVPIINSSTAIKPTKGKISPPMAAEASANNNNNNGNVASKKNKRVLITGANQGIGLHTALLLAQEGGSDITIACRSQERAQLAVQQIQAQRTDIRVDWLPLDLASLESVQQLVERIHKQQM
jgi:NADP-dependent 3-hydroxy acid dehydrogenase YdfG